MPGSVSRRSRQLPVKVQSVVGNRTIGTKMVRDTAHREPVEDIDSRAYVTGRHPGMLTQVLEFFEILPDFGHDLTPQNQCLPELNGRPLVGVPDVLIQELPGTWRYQHRAVGGMYRLRRRALRRELRGRAPHERFFYSVPGGGRSVTYGGPSGVAIRGNASGRDECLGDGIPEAQVLVTGKPGSSTQVGRRPDGVGRNLILPYLNRVRILFGSPYLRWSGES